MKTYRIFNLDCMEWLKEREADSVHAVCTDPPYGLVEFSSAELTKMRTGKGGIWRLPPNINGCKRDPLSERTVAGNLRRWKTGGMRMLSEGRPFPEVVMSSRTPKHEDDIAPHPCLKPQHFMRIVVRALLPLGEGVVLDPFMGAGATIAAAASVGYESIGIEIDREYFAMAEESIPRLARLYPEFHGETLMQPVTNGKATYDGPRQMALAFAEESARYGKRRHFASPANTPVSTHKTSAGGLAESGCPCSWGLVEELRTKNGKKTYEALWKPIRFGWCVGTETFEEDLLGKLKDAISDGDRESYTGAEMVRHGEVEAERLVGWGMKRVGIKEEDLQVLKMGAKEKALLAWRVHRGAMVSHRWIAERLKMGVAVNIGKHVRQISESKDLVIVRMRKALENG